MNSGRMKVTFLRHAISIFNELKTSEKDCELSQAGKRQAADLSGNYDLVICSIMTRTKQTLTFSKIRYNELIYSPQCREFMSDICDYLPLENETQKESKESLKNRAHSFKHMLKEKYSNKNILVVSHADFIFECNGGTKYPENAEFQVLEI